MKSRKMNLVQYEPKRCWVGDVQKICYYTLEEAEVAAKVAEVDHGSRGLVAYKCEYGAHFHIASERRH